MVYLARQEDSDYAEIVWKFNFSKSNLKIKTFKLNLEKKTFGEGQIEVEFRDTHANNNNIVNNLEHCQEFEICAKLSGGKGDVAWQHTQLFRQSLNSNEYPFDLQIELM